jgi:hypothetical protein
MAYHLARILQLDFGLEAIAVGEESAQNTVFDYDIVFPAIGIDAMRREITGDDLLIANPSFSDYGFGFNCRGRKIMYVQGFNTFRLLDRRFDLYVAVSGFVRNFLSGTYGIQAEVAPPFISADKLPPAPDWWERQDGSILVSHKRNGEESLDCLRRLLPEIDLSNTLTGKMPWRTAMEKIGRARIFLTLSPAEGFGLMPLEAMAMGCTVAGFDGFGGRDYLRPGVNCAVTAYADIEGIADQLTTLLANPNDARILADAGRATALAPSYTYSAFRETWRQIFSDFLGEDMRGTLKN